ncbi:MAG: cation-translocating P-type ATPase [Armatimonadetes bacterium]|nr:cation-translocating P-type ATPase [Armatimonadota bacterium]
MRFLRDPQSVLTALCGLSLIFAFLFHSDPLAYAAIACGSYYAFKSTWSSLAARELDVNFLMVFAAIGAIIVHRPLEAGVLLFLFSLSSTLESYAMSRTRNAIEGLMRLRPDEAILVTESGEERVRVEELILGQQVKIPPQETIPIDGRVISGESSVDESAMTGEARAVEKYAGETVIGGTQNQSGTLIVEVTATIEDSTLNKVVHLVKDAQDNKASGERVSSWFGQSYTKFVLLAFAVSLAIRYFAEGRDLNTALYSSITLLVALSPCALVISTPATTLSALAFAARRGMLIRGGKFIELAGQVKTIALDKTGTLTRGKPELVEICVCHEAPVSVGVSEPLNCDDDGACWKRGKAMSEQARHILSEAAAVEQYSAHPVATAIVNAAQANDLPLARADHHEAHPGLGVTAIINGKPLAAGQIKLFERLGLMPSEDFRAHAFAMADKGMSVALVHHEGDFAAMGLADAPRPEAADVLKQLEDVGVKKIVMITGDNPQTANSVANELNIKDVHASLMPQDKEVLIGQFSEEAITMMVGDGINDAPSLARASIGVAMGGLGSDIALNAADVVLMNDRLDRIPELIRLGKLTNRIIRANLIFASSVIIALTVSSFIIQLPLPIAVVGHEGSTVLVILNGLRLLRGPGS